MRLCTSSLVGQGPILPSLPKALPMEDLLWCFSCGAAAHQAQWGSRTGGSSGGAGAAEYPEFPVWSRSQTADPTGAHPVIPVTNSIFCTARAPSSSCPAVVRSVTMATAKLACSINRPVVHSGARRCNSALSRMAIKCQGCRFRALGVKRPASKILCMVFSGRSFGTKVRVVRRVRIHSKVSMHSSEPTCLASWPMRGSLCTTENS